MQKFSHEEYQAIMNSLVHHHAVFYQFWKLVKPKYSEDIDTACVSFNQDGKCVDFLINYNYWNNVDLEKKKFIICHECMHVLNSHGKRLGTKFQQYMDQANVAMDVVVNEGLAKYFGFDRAQIDAENEYCWFDKIFGDDKSITEDNSFEYYFNKIIEKNIMPPNPSSSLVNNHSELGIPDQFAQDIVNQLSDEEADVLKNIAERAEQGKRKNESQNQKAGTKSGQIIKKLDKKKPQIKTKWETIIKRFVKRLGRDETTESHWVAKDRRLHSFDSNIFIPSELECDIRKTHKDKIETYFFMDSSGSCSNLAQRFFDAAKSINPQKFDVKYFCFDTKIFKVDTEKNKLYGFGGTSFKAISDYIYKNKKVKPYVWVLTDGYGDYPDIPQTEEKKWSWFLIENGSERYIPKQSKIYSLANFE
jgi:predicted metal-dependent peptidase